MTIEIEDKIEHRGDPARLARVMRASARLAEQGALRNWTTPPSLSDSPSVEFLAACEAAGFKTDLSSAVIFDAVAACLDALARRPPDIPLEAQLAATVAVHVMERYVGDRTDISVDALLGEAAHEPARWDGELAACGRLLAKVGAIVVANRRKLLSR